MSARRFPPPWTAEVTPNCFIVRDANGQALSYVYYESEPGRRSAAGSGLDRSTEEVASFGRRGVATHLPSFPSRKPVRHGLIVKSFDIA